jgi:hypothetical protein
MISIPNGKFPPDYQNSQAYLNPLLKTAVVRGQKKMQFKNRQWKTQSL